MLSEETFKKIRQLSKILEKFEEDRLYSSKNMGEMAEIADNYTLIKVADLGTNNWHFELRREYETK